MGNYMKLQTGMPVLSAITVVSEEWIFKKKLKMIILFKLLSYLFFLHYFIRVVEFK